MESAPNRDTFLLVGGINRSGTTLARGVLGSHSQIAIPPEEFEFFKKLGPRGDELDNMGQEQFVRLVDEILSWRKVRAWGMDPDAVATDAQQVMEPTTAELFRLFLTAYTKQQGKKIAGEKTTYNEFFTPVFDRWFGDRYVFVHVVRNPIDVFASQKRYGGIRRIVNAVSWSRSWVESVQHGLRARWTNPDRYLLVRYEDLVVDPRSFVRSVTDRLDLSPEFDRMLEMRDFSKKNNSSFAQVDRSGIVAEDTVDRAATLTKGERKVVVESCRETAALLDYDLEAESKASSGLPKPARLGMLRYPVYSAGLTMRYAATKSRSRRKD